MNAVSSPERGRRSPGAADEGPRSPRPGRKKLGDAFRGLKLGVRGQSSVFVQFFFAALILATAVALRCTLLEWCILVGCIGTALVAELSNSAIQKLGQALDEPARRRAQPALEIVAGAALLATLTAILIVAIIFLAQMLWLLD